MIYKADFHNHSCLSPCASLEMGPRTLVETAKARGIKILALTDHNSARNTPAFEELCLSQGLLPLSGVEVCSAEEVHLLALFSTSTQALRFGAQIERTLPPIPLNPEKMGYQVVVNAQEEVLEEVETYLGSASSLGLEEIALLVHAHGGLFVPAHIDRPSNSLSSQLGYLPPVHYDALEVVSGCGTLKTGTIPLVRGSDAHYPGDIGRRTWEVDLSELTWSALVIGLEKLAR